MVLCLHCQTGTGCTIYERRPNVCRGFFCEYLLNAELGEEWKPATCHMVIMVLRQERRIDICVDNGYFALWRTEPYFTQIKTMALNMLRQRGCLVVWEGLEGVGILPDREVPIGQVGGHQIIVPTRRVSEHGEAYDIAVWDRGDPRLKPSS
jgi:hypothetical protein